MVQLRLTLEGTNAKGWTRVARVFGLFVCTAACSGSPASPAPLTVPLSGLVTATNGGQPLSDATIDVAGQHAITDAGGHFSVTTPSGRYQLMISGSGLLPHVQTVTAGPVTLDAIAQAGGFDLGFYRAFVRNGFEAPASLEPLRRLTSNPVFTVQTVDETGAAIDPAVLAAVRAAITAIVPPLTGNQFTASFGSGVPVRFVAALNGHCGESPVAPLTGGYIELRYRQEGCAIAHVAAHETGHALGYWHTDGADDVMMQRGLATAPSARERYHAAIAYSRPVGNRDPDTDP